MTALRVQVVVSAFVLLGSLGFWLVLPGPAAAQSILERKKGSSRVGASFDEVARASNGSAGSLTTYAKQWVSLPFSGSLLDPRIMSYNIILRPTFSQRGDKALPRSINSRTLDANGSLNLLSGQRFSLILDGGRTTGSTTGGFGTNSEFNSSALTTIVSWSNATFPMSVRRATRRTDSISVVGAGMLPYLLAYNTTTTRGTARSSKLTLDFGVYEYDDRLDDADYTAKDVNLTHAARWGRGSSLDSEYNWLEQDGRLDNARSTWRERLRIRHANQTIGTYRFQRTSSRNGRNSYTATQYSGRLDMQARPWLKMGVAASTRRAEYLVGFQRTIDYGPRLSLALAVPFGGRLDASLAVDHQNRRRGGSLTTVEVLNRVERLGPDGNLLLDEVRIEPHSIVIRSEEQNTLYEPGLDYELILAGSLVEIRSLPGGRLRAGQAIQVSFRVAIRSDIKENVLSSRFAFGLRFGALTMRHGESRRSARAEADERHPTLNAGDSDQRNSSIFYAAGLLNGRIRLEANRRQRRSIDFNYLVYEAQGIWTARTVGDMVVGVVASGRQSKERNTALKSYSLLPSLEWAPSRSLTMRVRGGYQAWDQVGEVRDQSLTAAVDVSWWFAAVEIHGSYSREDRIQKNTVSGSRYSVSMERRF